MSRAFTLPVGATIQLVNPVTLTIRLYQANGAYDTNDAALSANFKMTGAGNYTQIIGNHSNPNSQNLIQTITLTFPAGTFPQPTLPVGTLATFNQAIPPSPIQAAIKDFYTWGFDGRFSTAGQFQGSLIVAAPNSSAPSIFDTVRTVSVKTGDVRSVAATFDVPSTMFGVNSSAYSDSNYKALHYFHDNQLSWGNPRSSDTTQAGKIIPGISNSFFTDYPKGTDSYCLYGDFDGPLTRVTGGMGPFINKPDEGDNLTIGSGGTSAIPYYGWGQSTVSNLNLYTPNRIMPSPGMFGSLPTRVKQQITTSSGAISGSWQTLLFRPQPTHPSSSTTIPDHLIMDLFWMPIVEPYALSENFSTAGKVNMNYQILPFTYINRPTALMAAMKVEKIAARPLNTNAASGNTTFRLDLNTSETGGTLQQFKTKFALGNIFRSATEICDIDLVPTRDPNGTLQTWSASWGNTFWAANANTGDNTRERPYANLYARLTTKSNTFTIHVRAQALQKAPGTPPDQWIEGRDKVVGEERISTVVERYLDADSGLPDFATDTTAQLSDYYRMRTLSTKKFAP